MGGSSKSSSSNATYNYDQRQVHSTDARDYSNRSTSNVDLSDRSAKDYSDRSVTTINNADGAKVAQFGAELLRDVSADQTDTVKTLAAFGTDTIRELGGAVTDLYDNAGNQTAAAWTHTIDKSAEAFENLLTTARSTTDSARSLAEQALQTYQPADSKIGDTMKYSAIAAAVVVALMVMKKA